MRMSREHPSPDLFVPIVAAMKQHRAKVPLYLQRVMDLGDKPVAYKAKTLGLSPNTVRTYEQKIRDLQRSRLPARVERELAALANQDRLLKRFRGVSTEPKPARVYPVPDLTPEPFIPVREDTPEDIKRRRLIRVRLAVERLDLAEQQRIDAQARKSRLRAEVFRLLQPSYLPR